MFEWAPSARSIPGCWTSTASASGSPTSSSISTRSSTCRTANAIFRPFSLFPSSDIDLAFEVDEGVPASAVEDAIRSAGGDLLWSVRLFDVYRGGGVAEGRRSLAFALRLQAADRTLTDADVARARQQIVDQVQATLAATLRA